jgi:hypothetical protein
MLSGSGRTGDKNLGQPPGDSLGVPNGFEVYTSLSILVYRSHQGNKFSSPNIYPNGLTDFSRRV